jgi:hypothetical protein
MQRSEMGKLFVGHVFLLLLSAFRLQGETLKNYEREFIREFSDGFTLARFGRGEGEGKM